MTRTQLLAATITATLIALVLGVGLGRQWTRAEDLEEQLEETRHSLELERLEATIGAATVEAQRGSYEMARRLTSDFYTRAQARLPEAPAKVRATLEEILSQRDAMITALSRNDPSSADALARMFFQVRVVLGHPGPATPVVSPGPPTGQVGGGGVQPTDSVERR